MWCVPELTHEYIEKMEDVLATYEQAYDPAEPVVCVDEKPISFHSEVRPASAAAPGREARRDSEYRRCGTANVFCAVEPKAGRHFTFATPDRSAVQFAQVVFELAMQYPDARTIHLLMDNLYIHLGKSLTDRPGEAIGQSKCEAQKRLRSSEEQKVNVTTVSPVADSAQNPPQTCKAISASGSEDNGIHQSLETYYIWRRPARLSTLTDVHVN